ncbi:MAG: hypothetical protein F4232_08435 [Acidimicrobiaceae bacterium]|nr:hypothetical protein [Acidimicrobiaceae bacterium]
MSAVHDDNVELHTWRADDGSSFLALLLIEGVEAAIEYRFENAIPEGHSALLHADGSVRFFDAAGAEAGGIAAPWAIDADGTAIPTSYALDGTALVQTVEHRGAVYPVVPDPWWAPVAVVVALGACIGSVFCATMATAAVTLGPLVVGTAWRNRGSLKSGNSNSGSTNRPTNKCNIRSRAGC